MCYGSCVKSPFDLWSSWFPAHSRAHDVKKIDFLQLVKVSIINNLFRYVLLPVCLFKSLPTKAVLELLLETEAQCQSPDVSVRNGKHRVEVRPGRRFRGDDLSEKNLGRLSGKQENQQTEVTSMKKESRTWSVFDKKCFKCAGLLLIRKIKLT